MVESLLLSLRGLKPLVVDRILEDCVVLPIGFETLYGFQLSSNVERIKTVSSDAVNKILSLMSPRFDKILVQVIKRDRQDGHFYDSVYYFSYNKELLKILSEDFGQVNVRFLKGPELANVLFSLITLQSLYKISDKYRQEVGFHFKELGPVKERFYRMLREIKLEEYKAYAGVGHSGKVLSLSRVFKLNWSGAVYTVFDFNDPTNALKQKAFRSLQHFRTFKEMQDKVRDGVERYVGLSTVFITKEKTKEIAIDLLYSLGWTALELKGSLLDYVLCTPIVVRDLDWTFYLTPDVVSQHLFYSFAKSSYPQTAEIVGKNKDGALVAFSFFEENNNPHCMVFAPSGAGKSFAIQNVVCSLLELDVEKLYKGEDLKLRQDVRIRYFDKGFSAELLFKLTKERGVDVGIFSARGSELSLNPCEVFSDDPEEYDFSLHVVNACLTAIGYQPLVEMEAIFYLNALKQVAKNKAYRAFLNKEVQVLSIMPAMKGTYERLISLGYKPTDKIGSVKEPEFKNLHQPQLSDVVRLLGTGLESTNLSRKEKEALASAHAKLSTLAKEDFLNAPTQIDVRHHKVIYLDFEHLSRSRFFVPIVLTILRRLTMIDKFQKPPEERAYYVIDEAHNMLRDHNFRLALEVLIREARKYRISLIFLTQNFQEIPPTFIQNADTLMLISPQEEEARRAYIGSFYQHMGITATGQSDLEQIYFAIPSRTFVVRYSSGVFSLSLPVDGVKLQVFDSYRRELTTPDGKTIRKSMVMEGQA